MITRLSGIIPPVVTPFADEELNLDAHRRNIKRWSFAGLSGFLLAGSNGEAVFLDDDEKEALVEATAETAASGLAIIAGTGCESTRATVRLTWRLAAVGADAALVVTPAYFKSQMTPARLIDHYQAVADQVPVPILVYNFPQSTGLNLAPETIARLAAHPNIAGLKDSSGNVAQMAEILRIVPEDFAVFSGNAEVLYSCLCLGADGGILAVANVAPEASAALFQAVRSGDHVLAKNLQNRIGPLAALVTRIYGVGGLKAAMGLAGYAGGTVRSPLTMPGEEEIKALKAALAQLPPEYSPQAIPQ